MVSFNVHYFIGLPSPSVQFLHKLATLSTVTFLQIQFCSDFRGQSCKFKLLLYILKVNLSKTKIFLKKLNDLF